MQDEAALVEGVVAPRADHQMRGFGRQPLELLHDARRQRPVDRQQSRPPTRRQAFAEMTDHRRSARNVAAVVEDRISQQHDVSHGCSQL